MKRIFAIMLGLAMTYGAVAQSTSHEGKSRKRAGVEKQEKMADKLNLNDAQKMQVKSLNENLRKNLQELKQNTSLSNEAKKSQRETLVAQHRTQIQNILTPEQRRTWDTQKEERVGKNKKADGNRGDKQWKKNRKDKSIAKGSAKRDKNFEKHYKELNLDKDQDARLKAIHADYRSKMQAIKKDNSLTSTQKKEATKRLHKAHREDMKSVLTKEQIAKAKSIKKANKEDRQIRNTK